MKPFYSIIFFCLLNPFDNFYGQNKVLFSKDGEFVMARTSYYLKGDTMFTCFPLYKAKGGLVEFSELFTVKTPYSKKSAFISDVPKYILKKHKLKYMATPITKQSFKIEKKVISSTFRELKEGKKQEIYQVECNIFKDGLTIYNFTFLSNIDELNDPQVPRIDEAFYSKRIDKYFIILITKDHFYNTDLKTITNITSFVRITN